MVVDLENWEFSNYIGWIGTRNGVLFGNEILTEYFGNSDEYEKYIENYTK